MKFQALQERIYAGVLGKIIGVYMGRPVEGWSYPDIQDRFDEIWYYPHRRVGVPLIVADDDISGTFGFFRALEDCGYSDDISPKEIGETWLNYIIEDKTILWWGGPGRSTEHTAFLNLKNGISAPASGSVQQNGRAVAEQIGAQIFIEAFAMSCPGDPEKAASLVRKAASVSHDGMALDAACHLAAMDALAFREHRLDIILDEAFHFISDNRMKTLVSNVREICAACSDWRVVREKLDNQYGYHMYPGSCHIAPNHAMVLASLLCGGDDFQKSIMIAASAGWDTDCNAGNAGAFNGIRLGLDGLDSGTDLRAEVADRLLVITSDGGEAVSDAVQETRKIVKAVCRRTDLPNSISNKRFSFEYPGAYQGFMRCPYSSAPEHAVQIRPDHAGLAAACFGVGRGISADFSTPCFVEFTSAGANYLSTASPSLYETQTIISHAFIRDFDGSSVSLKIYVIYDDGEGPKHCYSPRYPLNGSVSEQIWTIPSLNGAPVLRMGFSVSSGTRFTGTVLICDADWHNAPKRFSQAGILMKSIWDTSPKRLQMWTSSAKGFAADMFHTFCIAHTEKNGVVTIGTRDWSDYTVQSTLTFSLHEAGGLVLRSRGHRQYYAACFRGGTCVQLLAAAKNGARKILAECRYPYERDIPYSVAFSCEGQELHLSINGETVLSAKDESNTYSSGGCGYFIDSGSMLADNFSVSSNEIR